LKFLRFSYRPRIKLKGAATIILSWRKNMSLPPLIHFLENKPAGKIDSRTIEIGCNTAFDAGLYTFTFAKTGAPVKARYTYTYKWQNGQWLISSHHSSAMPEKL